MVSNAPVAIGTAVLPSVNEDTAGPAGASVLTLFSSHFSDVDGNSLAGVAITSNAATSQGVWQYFNGAWVTVSSSHNESMALVLASGTLLRFLPAPNYNGTTPALTAYLIDNSGGAVTTGTLLDVSINGGQSRFSDASIALTTSITAVNDTPLVPATATTVGVTEQTAAILLGSITVSDVDLGAANGGSGDYGGASFTAQRALTNAADTFFFASSGLFTVSGSNLRVGGLTFATFSSTGGVLTINFTSSAAIATTSLVNDVLNHITYTNVSDSPPSSLTLNYALNDGSPAGGQGTGGTATASGSVLLNITAVNDAHTGGASITGTAAEDQVLTANTTLTDVDGLGTLHYQWQHDVGGGNVNVGADQSTYTLGDGDIGGIVRVVVYYTDAGGTVESASSAGTTVVISANDSPSGGVAIAGTTTENQVLTANTSTLADSDGLGTLHYQWQRNSGSGYVNVGIDQTTYILGDADVGGLVRAVISYTDGQGFANSVTSTSTAAIAGINDPHTGGASITGTATEEQVLSATSTLADADGLGTLHYQWQHDVGSGYVNIGTDQSTYTLDDSEVGGVVRVVISYTDDQGFAESATSAGTAAIVDVNDAPTGAVAIAGTTTEDQVLTANTSALADADGLGTLHFQWQRNSGSGYVNVGADQATYTLGDADVGGVVRVVTSYTDGQGFANIVTSASTAAIAGINDPHTGGASITGTATEDEVLSATSTLTDVDGLGMLHYDWQRDIGNGFASIGAADLATYSLGDADVAGSVRVVVSYTDGQGFRESATSNASAAISNINDAPVDIALSANAIKENAAAGTVIGALSGTDLDAGDSLTFSLNINPKGVFAIHSNGQIVLAAGEKLDFETKSSYEIAVTATDMDGATFQEAFTIDVQDIREPITGTSRANTLHGTSRADVILGLGGNDILDGRGGGDQLNGGQGFDTASYASAHKGVVVNLSKPGKNTGDADGDSFISIENVVGSKFNDTLVGNNKANYVDGGRGDDVLTGGSGSDHFVFGAKYGKDTITDFLATGKAHDVIDLSEAAGIRGFNDLTLNHIKELGGDLLITSADGSTLLLRHIGNVDDLIRGDFEF